MAQEEIQKPVTSTTAPVPAKEATPAPVTTEKLVTAPAPAATEEKVLSEKDAPVPVPEPEVTAAKEEEIEAGKEVLQTESFKEEGYLASELSEVEKKALDEFKEMVREALNKREFTAPPPPPPQAPVKEEAENTEENKEETSSVTETKTEEKSAAPVVTETKKEEKATSPAPVETKPAVPVVTKTEKTAPVETKPAALVVAETKKEDKATASAHVETKPAAPVTTETKKEAEKEEVVTIEKAFAADKEEGTKTVEAIEESIVSITLPETAASVEPEEVSIWGIPLLEDERSDVILLKFLRARDFKVKEALTMLKNTVQWRKDNNIDELVGEDLEGSEFEKIVFTHGVDKQGHVVIYSSYGEFQNKEIFADKEKLSKFLKWRIQFQEKCVRSLDFSPEAKSSFVFVSDFRNAPGLGKRALWQFIRRAVKQFEDNYPEFVAKELFINVPWWYIPYYKTFGTIITSPRTRSKMVLAGPSKSTETIFKYVAPEVVPVKYGGLSKESPFAVEDGVTEAVVKSSAKFTIDLPASEGSTLSWELRVLGVDVSYGAHFEPSNEASYTVIVSKNRKIGLTDEPVITDSFKASEPGKVVITIDNQTFKKKKLIYRFKTQP
ncbi:hypothetical protein AALP_AA1G246000 [Arabis alpina]|uniref:CRAL-TRIO domain-containing protein n=1 Tax=Arabis alpina TaxID=50452 RepID=A0A087HQE6_ARAAL|nr:hypothetical protein AALP_AA1G246000 [Arabis alpina]